MSASFNRPIDLALSGGGIRAMAFHLGVLKRLAERGLLEQVARISTVSGGSLLMGLVYQSNKFRWPSSKFFLDVTWEKVALQLCSKSLQLGAFKQLTDLTNFRFALSRSNLLAQELIENWGFDVPLSVLPTDAGEPGQPEWSINGTTAENGKRFRFKGTQIGDWDLGYAYAPNFPLGCALAVSAAFPVGFGPLAIDPAEFEWRWKPWGAPGKPEVVKLPFHRLHLYDGGLYDNLGAESFFHPGTQKPKYSGDYVVIVDAGAPLAAGMDWGPLHPFRIKRMLDIMSDQCRALRVRPFVNFLQQNPSEGAFLVIGTPVHGNDCAATFAKSFPTSLKRLSADDFRRLSDYGYDVVVDTERRYGVC